MSGPRVFWISEEDRLETDGLCPVLHPGPALSRHLVKSLRVSLGDTFRFVLPDPPVTLYQGQIRSLSPPVVSLKREPEIPEQDMAPPFDLAVALLKGDAWEDLIEPLVCLGTRSLIPLVADRSQVRWSDDQYFKKMGRFGVKIREASQLSGRLDRMEIPPPVTLGKVLEEPRGFVLFFDEESGIQPIQEVLSCHPDSPLALIGPEGGWSERERSMVTEFEKGGKGARVGLGSLIFPGRIAPVVAASVLSYCPGGRRGERGKV